jgi:hypothetical protein
MRAIRLTIALLAAATMLIMSIGVASAHEHRMAGSYEFTVGFLNEPAILEEPNGLDLRVQKVEGHQATPVEGLENTLKAEITYGGQTMPLEIEPAFRDPGAYTADVIPTAEGDYTFRIYGTIEGQQVDEQFTSSPTTFSSVESREALNFPVKMEPVAKIAETATAANAEADTAQMYGLAGIGVGVLGLIVGITGIMMARGARASDVGAARPTSHQAGDYRAER